MKTVTMPTVSTYYNKQGNNTLVDTGTMEIWFSYETPIAFRTIDSGLVVRENVWGPTTGKHLNAIDGGSAEAKKKRVSEKEFKELFAKFSK